MPPGGSAMLENGRLKRNAQGVARIPQIELAESDTNLLEQYLIDNDLMDDPKSAVRMMILSSMRDPRWAIAVVDRRKNLIAFRKALWTKMVVKLQEIQNEIYEELALLDNETQTTEATPNAD